MDVNVSLAASGNTASAGSAAFDEARSGYRGARLVVSLRAGIVSGRKHRDRLLTARTLGIVYRKKAIVGWNQHRGYAHAVERTLGADPLCHRLTGTQEPTRIDDV